MWKPRTRASPGSQGEIFFGGVRVPVSRSMISKRNAHSVVSLTTFGEQAVMASLVLDEEVRHGGQRLGLRFVGCLDVLFDEALYLLDMRTQMTIEIPVYRSRASQSTARWQHPRHTNPHRAGRPASRPRIWDDRHMPRDRRSSPRSVLRVSDADREEVVERLRLAAGDGRLTIDELSDRIEHAYAAKTFADLDAVTADLPGRSTAEPAHVQVIPPGVGAGLPGYRLTYRRSLASIAVRWAAFSLVCAAGFFLSGAHGAFWPVYVVLFGALRVAMVATRRRDQRRRSELMARQVGQIGGTSGLWGLFGPEGPFGRGGPGPGAS